MEAEQTPEKPTCWACRGAIDEGDAFCRYCGKRQQGEHEWYFRPLFIVFMAFFVLGPLALPLVWRSPALSRRARVGLTVAIVLYTLLLIWVTYLIIAFLIGHARLMLETMESM